MQLLEGQLSWLVHIIGAVIRGRNTSSTGESQVAWLSVCLPTAAFGQMHAESSVDWWGNRCFMMLGLLMRTWAMLGMLSSAASPHAMLC